MPLVEHDDLVLVRPVVHHVSQGQQRGSSGQNGSSPGWISLKYTVQYTVLSTVQYSTVQYSTVQYSAVQYSTVPHVR